MIVSSVCCGVAVAVAVAVALVIWLLVANREKMRKQSKWTLVKSNQLTPITPSHFLVFLLRPMAQRAGLGCRAVIEHNQDRRNKMETNQIRGAFPRPANFTSVSRSFCLCQELAIAPPTLSFFTVSYYWLLMLWDGPSPIIHATHARIDPSLPSDPNN